MSTKPTTSRGDKLPPIKETILTRRQSAQQKRQLRNKDSSIKRISQYTQLLLSPTRANTTKSPPTKSKGNAPKNQMTVKPTNVKNVKEKVPEKKDVKQLPKKRNAKGKFVKSVPSPKKSVEKVAEYYPNKLKRTFEGKKVVLKPKHEMKVVVGTRIGKRKLVLPQKGASTGLRSPPPKHQKVTHLTSPKPNTSSDKLSIEDLVHLHNDDMLDDEDWLEILTCPSPVWWEDPPDSGFDDEPILQLPVTTNSPEIQKPPRKRNKSHPKKTNYESHANITEVLSENNVKVLEMKKSDDKFMRKRSKLENLLGNIKNKVNNCLESGHNSDKINVKRELDEDVSKTVENSDMKPNSPESDRKSNRAIPKKEKRISESTEEDPFSNFRDDDLLNDLENIDIPIKSEEDENFKDKNAESLLENNSSVNKGENHVQQKDNVEEFSDSNSLQEKGDQCDDSNTTVIPQSPKGEENNEIVKLHSQISKLTTTSIEKDVSSSPLSAKSVNSISDEIYDSCSVKSQEADTISDTHIKFIDDDDVSSIKSCEISEKKEKIDNAQAKISNDVKNYKICNVDSVVKVEEIKQSCTIESVSKNNNLQNPRKERDCMTVYKIISSEKDNNKTNNKSNSMISKINELIKASKEYNTFKSNLQTEIIKSSKEYTNFKANLQSTETSNAKLDSFFKKHKNHQSRQLKRVENNSTDTSDNDNLNINNNNTDINERIEIENKNKLDAVKENTEIEQNQNSNEEKTIILPEGSPAIKYCLKCSCIFDTNNCHYCAEKAKNSTENHNSSCKYSAKLSNSEKSKDGESFLCDSCKSTNDG